METEKLISDSDIKTEIDLRYRDEEGYNLYAIEAFEIGIKIALELKKEGKSPYIPQYILDGYEWAVLQINWD